MKYGSSYNLRLGAIILSGAVLRIWFWHSTHLVLEDAFITFRYAENLASGNGFVYNTGEKVLGTTTPLWTFILASTKALGFNIFWTSMILNIVFDSLTCCLISSMLSGYRPSLALLWALLFACAPDIIPISMSGMETSLLLFTMSLIGWGAIRKSWFFALGIMLAFMTRPDSIVWIAAVVVCGFSIDARWFFSRGLIGILLVLPWIGLSQVYFGTVFPQSFAAKMASYPYELKVSVVPFLNYFTPVLDRSPWKLILKNILFIFLIAGVFAHIRQKGWLGVFPIFFFAYCILFMFSGRTIFTWYMIPAIFCWLVLISSGIHFCADLLTHRVPSLGIRYASMTAILVLIVAVHLAFLEARTTKYREEQAYNETFRKRIGLWIHDHAVPGSVILLEPLGYMGYYAGDSLRIYDEIGIVSPEILRCQKSGPGWYGSVLQNVRPDYIVQYSYALDINRAEGTGRPLFAASEDENRFYRDYQLAAKFDISNKFPGIEAKEKKFVIFHRGGSSEQPPSESLSVLLRNR